MSIKARILARMFAKGTITETGLRKAVSDRTITAEEFEQICGVAYEVEA